MVIEKLATVYCGYNSRLTVYCLHIADASCDFQRNHVQWFAEIYFLFHF